MEERKHSISLSFLLLRFVLWMIGSVLLCIFVWFSFLRYLESKSIVYPGHVGYQQVEQLINQSPKNFVQPGNQFVANYVLIDKNGKVIASNVKKQEQIQILEKGKQKLPGTMQHLYTNKSQIVFQWHFRKEFVNSTLRAILPPFEYLWWGSLVIACSFCWIINAILLKNYLASKLQLFCDVSQKVGKQQLDFKIPYAGIKEFDQALYVMEQMKEALYLSLSNQWADQQQRNFEMEALAHDLKTPLTLIGGNAELLLEENLKDEYREMLCTILESNDKAKEYVDYLLDTSCGKEEDFVRTSFVDVIDEAYQKIISFAKTHQVQLQLFNDLQESMPMQKQHMVRSLTNIIQNAIEHTQSQGSVTIKSFKNQDQWQIVIYDEGSGFSKEALLHATKRLWREDKARTTSKHNGLGLWFASQVVHNHKGSLQIGNYAKGGVVCITWRNEVVG